MGRIDPDSVPVERGSAQPLGAYERRGLGDAGGLGQFGVAVETLSPGAQSSHRHWHSDEDEFLWMLAGEAVLAEDSGETVLRAGDAVAWKAGVPVGHHLINRSDGPVRFLVVGARAAEDRVRYPDLGRTLHNRADGSWQMIADDGTILNEGRRS